MKFASGKRFDDKMTRIRKTSPSIAEQLPKQMARILYNTLIHEGQRPNSEVRVMSTSEPSPQSQHIANQSELLNVVEPKENSTWRIGFHKRDSNTIWLSRIKLRCKWPVTSDVSSTSVKCPGLWWSNILCQTNIYIFWDGPSRVMQ